MEYECRGKKGAGGGRDREICEREAPKIDAFPMQNSRSTTLLVAGQHATGNPLLTSVSLSLYLSLFPSRTRALRYAASLSIFLDRSYVSASTTPPSAAPSPTS